MELTYRDSAAVLEHTASPGSNKSFQLGAALGYAASVIALYYPFLELGWMLRQFPGTDWDGSPLPPKVARAAPVRRGASARRARGPALSVTASATMMRG